MNVRAKSIPAIWMIIAMPMNLLEWTQVRLPSKEIPKIMATDGGFRLTTHHSAGGFVYLLPEPLLVKDDLSLSWQWMVSQFPAASDSKSIDKKSDDYALRVGVLFDDGSHRMMMPTALKNQLAEKGRNLSFVVFYCASSADVSRTGCLLNPFSNSVVNCLKPAGPTKKYQSVFPVSDLRKHFTISDQQGSKLKIIGLWLFADSDNGESDSDAWVSQLQFSP